MYFLRKMYFEFIGVLKTIQRNIHKILVGKSAKGSGRGSILESQFPDWKSGCPEHKTGVAVTEPWLATPAGAASYSVPVGLLYEHIKISQLTTLHELQNYLMSKKKPNTVIKYKYATLIKE